jgi:hypothetical protein
MVLVLRWAVVIGEGICPILRWAIVIGEGSSKLGILSDWSFSFLI